jgi:sulfur carrier protein
MKIDFNGKNLDVDAGLSLEEFINSRKLDPSKIIVEYNTDIIDEDKWSSVTLKESDSLVVLSFVGGG